MLQRNKIGDNDDQWDVSRFRRESDSVDASELSGYLADDSCTYNSMLPSQRNGSGNFEREMSVSDADDRQRGIGLPIPKRIGDDIRTCQIGRSLSDPSIHSEDVPQTGTGQTFFALKRIRVMNLIKSSNDAKFELPDVGYSSESQSETERKLASVVGCQLDVSREEKGKHLGIRNSSESLEKYDSKSDDDSSGLMMVDKKIARSDSRRSNTSAYNTSSEGNLLLGEPLLVPVDLLLASTPVVPVSRVLAEKKSVVGNCEFYCMTTLDLTDSAPTSSAEQADRDLFNATDDELATELPLDDDTFGIPLPVIHSISLNSLHCPAPLRHEDRLVSSADDLRKRGLFQSGCTIGCCRSAGDCAMDRDIPDGLDHIKCVSVDVLLHTDLGGWSSICEPGYDVSELIQSDASGIVPPSSCDASSEGTVSESESFDDAIDDMSDAGKDRCRRHYASALRRISGIRSNGQCRSLRSSPIKELGPRTTMKRHHADRFDSLTDVSEAPNSMNQSLRCSSDGAIDDLKTIDVVQTKMRRTTSAHVSLNGSSSRLLLRRFTNRHLSEVLSGRAPGRARQNRSGDKRGFLSSSTEGSDLQMVLSSSAEEYSCPEMSQPLCGM